LSIKSKIAQNLNERPLNEREREILKKIVHLYILKAAPIGSRYLAKSLEGDLSLSPATLRNIMSDLEELEYIGHPHTSAGRVPTDKGYRFYVNSISPLERLSDSEISAIQETITKNNSGEILKNASKVLGMLSRYLGVVHMPGFSDLVVEKIELIRLSASKLLVVLALESNIVKTLTIEARHEMGEKYLEPVTRYINERVSGRPLSFIRENFDEIIGEYEDKDSPLIRLFVDSLDEIFTYRPSGKVLIAGAQNLLEYPEFEDLDRVRSIIELVEDEDIIVHLMDKKDSGGLGVFIGSELQSDLLEDYSLIKTNYKFGSANGVRKSPRLSEPTLFTKRVFFYFSPFQKGDVTQ
jgi:heat-inducible transcriptional repressor